MKVNEKIHYDEGEQRIIVQSQYDNDPYLREAEALRAAGVGQKGDNKLVGRIPMHLLKQWFDEAGISWDDPAASDVIKRKMLSGDFDKFRVWEGTY
jgi:hypothetical protein